MQQDRSPENGTQDPEGLRSLPMWVVEWIDSEGESGWRPARDASEDRPTTCLTVGWLLSESDEHLTLVQSLNPKHSYVCGEMTIPRSAVLSIRSLSTLGILSTYYGSVPGVR